MFRSLGLGCIAAIAVSACATEAAPSKASITKIVLTESCGMVTSCTPYQITVTPDGHFVIDLRTLRKQKADFLGPGAWNKAVAAIEAAKFDTLPAAPEQLPRSNGEHFPCMPDSPHALVAVTGKAGVTKEIDYNMGCDNTTGNALLTSLRDAFQWSELVK